MCVKKIICVFFLAGSLFVGMLVQADISPKVGTSITDGKLAKGPQKSSLRCWQYGKLLFEENNLQNQTMKNNREAVVFEEIKIGGKTIYVFELGATTCLYKKV